MKDDDELKKLAPVFLRDMHGDPRNTCMAWGCECGDGWKPAIWEMCTGIEELNDGSDHKAVALQIKEKFADLTVYWTIDDDVDDGDRDVFRKAVDDIIAKAVAKCAATCEICGQPATRLTRGWLRHVCDKCANETENRKKEVETCQK